MASYSSFSSIYGGRRTSTAVGGGGNNNSNLINSNSGLSIYHRQHGGGHNHNTSSSADVFPRLSVEEVRNQLARMAIELPPGIWTSPQPEEVQGLYSVAIEDIFDKKLKDIRIEENTHDVPLLKIDGTDILPLEGRLHIRALGNLRFFRYCQKLCFHVLGIYDFNRVHIFHPDSSSVIRFGSAFVHFLRFRECIYSELRLQIDEFSDLADTQLFNANEQCRMCEIELMRLSEEREVKQNEMKEIYNLNKKMEYALQELSLQHQKQLDINQEKSNKITALQSESSELDLNMVALRQQLDDLKDQVVHSPQKLQQRQKDITKDIKEKQKHLESTNNEIDRVLRHIELAQKANKKIKKLSSFCNSHIQDALKKYGQCRLEKKKIDREIENLKKQENELSEEAKIKVNKINKIKEKINKAEEEWKAKKEEGLTNLQKNKESAKKEKEKANDLQNQINETNEEIENVMEEIKKERKENLKITNKFNEVEKLIEENAFSLIEMYENLRDETARNLSGVVCSFANNKRSSSASFTRNSVNSTDGFSSTKNVCNKNKNDVYVHDPHTNDTGAAKDDNEGKTYAFLNSKENINNNNNSSICDEENVLNNKILNKVNTPEKMCFNEFENNE